MTFQNEAAGLAGHDGSVVSEAVAAQHYLNLIPTVKRNGLGRSRPRPPAQLHQHMAAVIYQLPAERRAGMFMTCPIPNTLKVAERLKKQMGAA